MKCCVLGASCLAAAALGLLAAPAEAGPPAYKVISAAEDYLKAVRGASGTLRLEGADVPAIQAWLGGAAGAGEGAAVSLPFSVERDARFQLGEGEAGAVEFKELHLRRTPPAVRALAAALGGGKLNTTAKRLGGRLPNELITLDRIDGRLVWALGDEGAAIWVDKEVYRPVRYHYGAGVLDDHAWTVRLEYDEAGGFKGWFPVKVTVYRDGEVGAALAATVEGATLR